MKVIRFTGSPVYAAVAALAAAHDDPELVVASDLTALQSAEGELMGLGPDLLAAPAWFTGLATAIWPAVQVRDKQGLREFPCAVALIDPLQCLMALAEVDALDLGKQANPSTEVLEVHAPDRRSSPSRMVQSDIMAAVTVPVVYSANETGSRYTQVLPVAPELAMSRDRTGCPSPSAMVEFLRRPGWTCTAWTEPFN